MNTMRRTIKLLVAGTAVALCACTVENNQSIAVLRNGLPEDDCTFSAEPDTFLGSGTMDVSLGDQNLAAGYLMGLLVENRMPETVTSRPPMTGSEVERTTERNQILIRGFEVELEAQCEGEAICGQVTTIVNRSFRTPGAASVGPLEVQPILADVLPLDIPRRLKGVLGDAQIPVRVTIRAYGGRNADEEIESGDFEYSISLCEGCLVSGLDRQCPGGPSQGYCGLPQDFSLSCCLLGSEPVCPASLVAAE